MATKPKTGFDRFFDAQMRDPEFAAAYRDARAEIDSVDTLMRELESARIQAGISKAELARRSQMPQESVRRLFTEQEPNPGFSTVMTLARSMGRTFRMVPIKKKRASLRGRSRPSRTSSRRRTGAAT